MATLNETPSSNRLHIGIFGKTNSGKSSLINAFTKQQVSIVSDVKGTTTDLVYKPMEINPLGPCVIIDTAGFDDDSELGEKRIEKTNLAAQKTDIAVIVFDAAEYFDKCEKSCENASEQVHNQVKEQIQESSLLKMDDIKELSHELGWIKYFKEKKIPLLLVINKIDVDIENANKLELILNPLTNDSTQLIKVSTKSGEGIELIKPALARLIPEDFGAEYITGSLVGEDDLVMLVMPQDIQAPKGRLILPQVQTIRELLDKKCTVVSVTTDKMTNSLTKLTQPPKLIITDSQVFDFVYQNKPKESMLTSFSVLFAAYKGDLSYYIEGAKAIDSLTENSKVLIAECCTHAPLSEDIGRVKIPRMLRKRFGEGLTVDMVSGTDFPKDPSDYDLIIQCGACMFNRKYVLSRIETAKKHSVPMTNYGVTIAHITGILDKIALV